MLHALLALVVQTVALDATPRDNDGPVGALFTPDNRGVVLQHVQDNVTTLTYLDLALGRVTAASPKLGAMEDFRLTPDGTRALLLGHYGIIQVLSVPNLEWLFETEPYVALTATWRMRVAPNGARAVVRVSESPNIFAVVSLSTGMIERTIPTNIHISSLGADPNFGFSPDGGALFVADWDALVKIDLTTGQELLRTPYAMPGLTWGVTFSGDGLQCAVHRRDGTDPLTPNRIERFSLVSGASLGVVTLNTTAPLTGSHTNYPLSDHSGTMLLYPTPDGRALIDASSGATRLIEADGGASISADGTRVMLVRGAARLVIDTATGATLATFPGEAGVPPGRIFRSHTGSHFAALDAFVDRVDVFDASGPVPRHVMDINSGFGPEGDGPWALAFDTHGNVVVAAGRDSDELCVIAVDGTPRVSGRLPLDRQPIALALREDGRALVAHGRGQSLSVVDITTRTELVRHPLPEKAAAIRAEPTGTAAWVLLQSSNERALAHVDTQTGSVLGLARLPGQGTPIGGGFLDQADVVFDFVHRRAFVAIPADGALVSVDLDTFAVTHAPSVPVTGRAIGRAAALALSSDGALLVHQAGRGHARAFDVSTGSFVPRWEWRCVSNVPVDMATAAPFFAVSETQVVIPYVTGSGPSTCPDGVILDALTGISILTLNGACRFGLDLGSEVWLAFPYDIFPRLQRMRLSTVSAQPLVELQLPQSCAKPIVHPMSRIAVTVLGQEGSRDLLHRIDALEDLRLCPPTTPNSIGLRATLRIDGTDAAGGTLSVVVSELQPGSMAGYLLVGDTTVPPIPLPLGPGVLCLGGQIGRFTAQAQVADAFGRHSYTVDTARLPTAVGTTAVLPGSSWVFQAWYRDRDASGIAASHTSDSVRVRFQ